MKAIWLALGLVGCQVLAPAVDDGCAASCARWRALECAEGAPTPDGAPCEEWCGAAEREGIDIAGPSVCAEQAATCAAVSSCGSRR